jgi:dihydroxyacetone kinase
VPELGVTVSAVTVKAWMRECSAAIAEQRDYLTQLDAAIGDADHGANMTRGFAGQAADHGRLDARLHGGRRERPALGLGPSPGRQGARR